MPRHARPSGTARMARRERKRAGTSPGAAVKCAAMNRRRAAGQAMTEYGIVVALVSGIAWMRHIADGVDPRTLAMAAVGGVVLLVFLLRR